MNSTHHETISQNLQQLIIKNPSLSYVLGKLEKSNIRYGLYAGSHLAVLTSTGTPNDVDLLVHDDDMDKLKSVFPFAATKDTGDGIFLYVGRGEAVEFMTQASMVKNGTNYPYRLTDAAAARVTQHTVGDQTIKLVDTVDTLLLKAILQRGKDQGKHDIEDIELVLKDYKIDEAYLNVRIQESQTQDLVGHIFNKLGY